MNPEDLAGFFAERDALDPQAYLELDYTFECVGDPRVAAASICREQSTAQWKRVGVDEDFRPLHGAKVLEFHAARLSGGFSLDIPKLPAGEVHRCRVTIAHPHGNFGPRLPNLISAVMGEGAFFVPGVPIIKLEDIRFPDSYLAGFPGPQFGVAGIRARLDVHDRPIFIGVIKPNIGLAPEPFAALAEEAWLGGLDIAKDDEMLGDVSWSPLATRTAMLGAARARAEQETGQHKMYMANVTDEVSRLAHQHDVAVGNGANALLVNALPVGLSGVRLLREHARVPIFGHFPLIAAASRVPGYGVHSRVFTRLQRMAGCDAVIMPGLGPRMMVTEQEVLENVQACLEPMGPMLPALPVPGGSDSAATLADVHRRLGTRDFGFIAGRGIFGHVDGPRGGAQSVRRAWQEIARAP